MSRLSAAVVTLFAGYDVSVGIDVATTAVINNCAATMERQVFESSALKEALQEAVSAVPGMLDKAAGVIEDNPEAVEAGAQIFMAAGGVMAEDRGTKAPKIKTKGQAKADKVLAKGYASAAKSMAKGLRTVAGKMREGDGKPTQKLLPNPVIGPERQLTYQTKALANPVIGPKRQIEKPKHTPYAGGVQRSFVTTKEETYYRVYSRNPEGAFLAKVKPANSNFAREGLALPVGNSADFIQEVIVPKGVRLQRSRVLPAYGRRGTLEQFEILRKEERMLCKFLEGVPFS